MARFEWIHAVWLLIAAILEIAANIALKYADGFRRPLFGVFSLIVVVMAFCALGEAVKGIELSVAYALWGGLGVIATASAGAVLFDQHLNYKGWLGLFLLIVGMVIMRFA